MKKNLTLTGMMGVGKSSIGKALSKQLSMKFIDIDKIIEKELKLSIQEIFEQEGESYFRKLEEEVTLEQLKKNNRIISAIKKVFTTVPKVTYNFYTFLRPSKPYF